MRNIANDVKHLIVRHFEERSLEILVREDVHIGGVGNRDAIDNEIVGINV